MIVKIIGEIKSLNPWHVTPYNIVIFYLAHDFRQNLMLLVSTQISNLSRHVVVLYIYLYDQAYYYIALHDNRV